MQTRSSDEHSVRLSARPSLCLSVTRVHCDKTVEICVQIYIPYEKNIYPSFLRSRMVGGGDPFT